MTPQQFWRTPFGSGPWSSLAGDADGDGLADLLAVGASGDSIVAMARTSPQGKPLPDHIARPSIGKGVVAIAGGKFSPGVPSTGVVTIFADGSIKVAWGMGGSNTFSRTDAAGHVPTGSVPAAPARSAVADFDGDGKPDVLVLDKDARLLLLRNITDTGSAPKFAPSLLYSNLVEARMFSAGTLGADKRARVIWLDAAGSVKGAFIEKDSSGAWELGATKALAKASAEDHIAVGRFRGGKGADLLVGQKLFIGGDPKAVVDLPGIPSTNIARDDGAWEVADIDGNGKDDLIRHRERGPEPFGGQDVYVHFSYDNADAAKGFYCSANDGLLDVWKIGKIKPGGLDLAAIGCQVGRRDIIIEIERFDNEPEERLRANLDRVVRYFAKLPVRNPDGSTGIFVHLIYRTPWPLAKKDEVMGRFDELFPPVEHRGIVHSAFTMSGGPLVSQICGDHGKTNEGWAEFLHEFGHQLNLRHDGFYPSQTPGFPYEVGCALYSSLMSYSYSYTVGDSHDRIGYSDGSLASFPVNERNLSEKLPFPIEKVNFLAGGPYRFKIKAGADGKSTFVDWNWNGAFDEQPVVADLNYSHGVDLGRLYNVGKTDTAPILVAHGEVPLLVYGRDSRLTLRTWEGANRDTEGHVWSGEVSDVSAGMIGDPSATYLNGVTWIAYPTAKGTAIRSVTLSGTKPTLGPAGIIPNTTGVHPTVAAFGNRLGLLAWRSKNSAVGLSILRVNGTTLSIGGERNLDMASDAPVGAVAGPVTDETSSLFVGRVQGDGRNELVRYDIGVDGTAKAASRSWISGTYARYRMTLLWRKELGPLPDGRLYQLTGGNDPPGHTRQQWITMNVPYGDVTGGWFYRRYHQAGFTSPSAPGACFFKGSILYAVRFDGSNDLNVAFYADGATPTPLGDFNDLAHICDYGLSRSIRGLLK